ncbi:hypothetical protein BG011_005437 [Mortierella polycephala]|uniref:BHLH domain-containing protein n=1 Tax=Mortierella polycephala TaxID=41804 RepID=A0A9P6U0B0_9FUNG|nr:hypothetical protein BG011_005437 [Mortierella polycephala]
MDIKAYKPAPIFTLSPPPLPASNSSSSSSVPAASSYAPVGSIKPVPIETKKKPYTKMDGAPKNINNKNQPNSKANKGERIVFQLDDVLRKYSPEQFKTCKAYDVGGVNILNKKPVDSKTALDKIKRRRETHNRVERRRRDCINQLIDELTSLLPREDGDSASKCHRVNVLKTAVTYIQDLTRHNETLNQQLQALQTGQPMPLPALVTTPPSADPNDRNGSSSSSSQQPYIHEPNPSLSSYTPHAPRSPISTFNANTFSPGSSPRLSGAHQEFGQYCDNEQSMARLAPMQLPNAVSLEAVSSSGSSRPTSPSPSLPSLNDINPSPVVAHRLFKQQYCGLSCETPKSTNLASSPARATAISSSPSSFRLQQSSQRRTAIAVI